MSYTFKLNKGETFRRELTWKDSQDVNLFSLADSVDLEVKNLNDTVVTTTQLAINVDKITLLKTAAETALDIHQTFHIFANMHSGDRILVLSGVLVSDG